mgnify:CR=1 FL=1
MQTVLDMARVPLNDVDKVRYPDLTLLKYLNAGIAKAYEIRPDLKFGAYDTPYAELALGATFPLPYAYKQALADYVVFRAETVDDENVVSQRAALFLQSFEKELLSA